MEHKKFRLLTVEQENLLNDILDEVENIYPESYACSLVDVFRKTPLLWIGTEKPVDLSVLESNEKI